MEPEQLLPQRLVVLGESPAGPDQQRACCLTLSWILALFLLPNPPCCYKIFTFFSPVIIVQLSRVFILTFLIV